MTVGKERKHFRMQFILFVKQKLAKYLHKPKVKQLAIKSDESSIILFDV